MDYSKFYTPINIANLLVGQLNIDQPQKAVDICCGSCNLLHAAKRKWNDIELVGVDVIEHSENDVECIKKDGRQFAITHKAEYPLVLANPPFDAIKEKGEFVQLYHESIIKYQSSRLEIEMLLANLYLLAPRGTLMIIMPSTFVEAESQLKIRKFIADTYYVQTIIKLPENTFGTSKINSYAIVIENIKFAKEPTRWCEVAGGDHSKIKQIALVDYINIKNGKWCIPVLQMIKNSKSTSFKINRGNISSQMFVESGIGVLHTAKNSSKWKPSVRYVNKLSENCVFAKKGNIIVSRIGKSAGQWCVYTGSKRAITDCLFRIEDPEGVIAKKIQGREYSLPLKGVATRYITKTDFELWLSSI